MSVSVAAVYGYYFSLQTPEKVVFDALSKAVHAEAVQFTATTPSHATFKGEIKDGNVRLDGALPVSSATNPAKGEVRLIGESLYAKSDMLDSVAMDQIGENLPPSYRVIMSSLLAGYNGKWIEFPVSQLATNASVGTMRCSQGLREILRNDQAAVQELKNIYTAHPFLIISKKADMTYLISIEDTKIKEFRTALGKTSFFRSVISCHDGTLPLIEPASKHMTLELTIDTARTLRTLAIIDSETQKQVYAVDFSFTESAPINPPPTSESFESIQKKAAVQIIRSR